MGMSLLYTHEAICCSMLLFWPTHRIVSPSDRVNLSSLSLKHCGYANFMGVTFLSCLPKYYVHMPWCWSVYSKATVALKHVLHIRTHWSGQIHPRVPLMFIALCVHPVQCTGCVPNLVYLHKYFVVDQAQLYLILVWNTRVDTLSPGSTTEPCVDCEQGGLNWTESPTEPVVRFVILCILPFYLFWIQVCK